MSVDAEISIPSHMRIGVALGGGSARGYAHIGALSTLERYQVYPEVIAGTSFGAVIGALYASGKTPEQMTQEASVLRRRDVFPHIPDFGLHKAALFSGQRLERYFERMLEGRSFADLEKQLLVVTTDIDTGERVLLREGSLSRALRASASIPGIFAPVEIDGRRLVDGGLGSPVPIDTLKNWQLDLAIGIGAGTTSNESGSIRMVQKFLTSKVGQSLHKRLQGSSRVNPLSRLGRGLAYTANTYMVAQIIGGELQVHTNPPINWLSFHQAEQAIFAGEQALEAYMPTIFQALQGLSPLVVG